MDAANLFVWIAVFLMIYGSLLAVSYVIDKALRKLGKKGIWPEGYFKW